MWFFVFVLKSQESYGHCTNNSIHVSKHDVVWARGKENDNVLSARTMKEVEYGQNKFHMVSPPSAAKKMKPLLSATSCLNLKQGMDSPILKVMECWSKSMFSKTRDLF